MGLNKGGLEGCGRFLKFCLLTVNVFILFGGLSILGLGIWTLLDKFYIETLLRNHLYMSSTYIMIGVGTFMAIVSLLGCFGAYKDVKCLLLTYFILIFLSCVVLLIGGVLAYVFRDQVEHNLKPEMLHTIETYRPNATNFDITNAWDATQKNLKCCGIARSGMESTPWKAWKMNKILNPGYTTDLVQVPRSCCKIVYNVTSDCTSDSGAILSLIHKNDCFEAALVFVRSHACVMGGVAIGIGSVMVFGMIFSIVLFKIID